MQLLLPLIRFTWNSHSTLYECLMSQIRRSCTVSELGKKMPSTLGLFLLLLLPLQAASLSVHSPKDLFAYPKYSVVLDKQAVLNDTVTEILSASNDRSGGSSEATVHLLRTPTGQAFLCTVPAASEEQGPAILKSKDRLSRQVERERGLERGLDLLESMRDSCIYLKNHGSWFSYSFCYGGEIRQFHAVEKHGGPPTEDPNHDSFTLGQAPSPEVREGTPIYGSGSALARKREERIPSALGGGTGGEMAVGFDQGGRYLSQIWESGTVCDKTGLPRSVEVQYHCNTQSIDKIAIIRESAICQYVMVIHTPRLCGEPVFLEGHDNNQEPASIIQCQPVVKKLRELVDPPKAAEDISSSQDVHQSPALDIALLQRQQQEGHLLRQRIAEYSPPQEKEPKIDSVSVTAPDVPAPAATAAAVSLDATDGAESEGVESSYNREGDQTLTIVYNLETGERTVLTSSGIEPMAERAQTPEEGGSVEGGDEVASIKGLQDLTRIMQQSIADALRQHVGQGQDQVEVQNEAPSPDPANPQGPAEVNNNNNNQADPIAELFAALTRSIQKKEKDGESSHSNPGSNPADGSEKIDTSSDTGSNNFQTRSEEIDGVSSRNGGSKRPPDHPGLHAFLKNFDAAAFKKATAEKRSKAALRSEQHSQLAKRFQERYDVEEDEKDEEEKSEIAGSDQTGFNLQAIAPEIARDEL